MTRSRPLRVTALVVLSALALVARSGPARAADSPTSPASIDRARLDARIERIASIRVDRYERDQQPEILGIGRFRTAFANADSLDQAKLAVPASLRR